MINILQRIWHGITPDFFVVFVRFLLQPKSYKLRRNATLSYYKSLDKNKVDPEIKECLRFLKYHKYSAFPYNWTLKYDQYIPQIFFDKQYKAFYNIFEGKKMYFPVHYSQSQVIWTVRSILKEQDCMSPHLYLTDDFQVEPDSIVIDAGVAEGNFALKVVEHAKLLYLIECDSEWMTALKLTFAPWKEKVIFIEKYISDSQSETSISIDSLINPEPGEKYFIKMDVEGFEKKALNGMQNLIESGCPIKLDVCTYHHPNDLYDITEIVKSKGFKWHVSNGYVLYSQPDEIPTFRKVLIRAEKK